MYSVLVVDDDNQLLRLIRDVFEIEGWQVTVCQNSHEAMKAIEETDFHCCVVDLHLPDEDGRQLILRLHDILQIPIIAISGTEVGIDLAATRQVGADYHLKKPFEPDELVIECRRLIENSTKESPSVI